MWFYSTQTLFQGMNSQHIRSHTDKLQWKVNCLWSVNMSRRIQLSEKGTKAFRFGSKLKIHSFPALLNSNHKLFFPSFKFDQTETRRSLRDWLQERIPKRIPWGWQDNTAKKKFELAWWVDLGMHACVPRVSILPLGSITGCMRWLTPERAYRSVIYVGQPFSFLGFQMSVGARGDKSFRDTSEFWKRCSWSSKEEIWSKNWELTVKCALSLSVHIGRRESSLLK